MRSSSTAGSGRRVVVVGGGFAGLSLCQALPRSLDVTLVDPSPSLEFLPNIHELVSGRKRPEELRLPRAERLARAGHRFVLDRVTAIERAERRALTAGGEGLSYDVLVLAIGGQNATFGLPGVAQHGLPFKSVDQCAAIGARLERLAAGASPAEPAPVVVVGGGFEGVEALGEILRRFRAGGRLGLTLVEAGERLLPEGPPGLHRAVLAHCREHGVTVLTSARVSGLGPETVELADGRTIPSRATLWTVGLAPPPLLAESGLAAPGAFAPVHPTLVSRADPRVLVLGDAAELPRPLSKQAYHALAMGAHAAETVQRLLSGRAPRPFSPPSKPALISFGDLDTFFVAGPLALGGAALAPLKEGVYQLVMAQLDPPLSTRPARGLLGRARKAGAELLGGSTVSLARLRRQRGVRLLR